MKHNAYLQAQPHNCRGRLHVRLVAEHVRSEASLVVLPEALSLAAHCSSMRVGMRHHW